MLSSLFNARKIRLFQVENHKELCYPFNIMDRYVQGKLITHVEEGSPAAREGLLTGDILLSVNGERVKDLIDYEALSVRGRLVVEIMRGDEHLRYLVRKKIGEPLGLCFETTLMDRMQTCKNRCLFCFVDQMPKGIRSSLNVKDDDWRLSFIMGNYVTLTNVSEEEFNRILKRRVSPLYVSVHTTDPALRVKLMSNPTAGMIMDRLTALKEAGITFHTQIVLCPGINDGEALERSLEDLASLYPLCASVAAVPVGLTKYREGLFPLRGYTPSEAEAMVAYGEQKQAGYQERWGDAFFYLSDEWYLTANLPLPSVERYGDFPQIENGVGLLRLFESEFRDALEEKLPLSETRRVTVAGGVAANPFFRELYSELLKYNIDVATVPVNNTFFGGNVHVAGLVTASDILATFHGHDDSPILIPRNMLREKDSVFLDGISLAELENKMNRRIIPFNSGRDFIELVFGEKL